MAVSVSGAADSLSRTAGMTQNDPSTVMFWVRRDTATALGCLHVVVNAGVTAYEGIYTNTAGTGLRLENQGGGADGSSTLTAGTWYHVARVRNGTNRTLYLDGVSEVTLSGANAFTTNIEAISGNGIVAFPGYMSAFKSWNAALTADEVLQEMRSVRPMRFADLVSRSPLFRHTEVQDYNGTGWTLSGTGLTDDGPPVSWGVAPIIGSWVQPSVAPATAFQPNAF